jgi:signal transduction histidine kinase/CheY-like chemotaxis protein
MTLRSHLLALVLVTLVPVLLFSAVLVVVIAQHERRAVERGSLETARALSASVDQQINGATAALSALALSSRLASGDLRGFYEEARALKDAQDGWDSVFLYDRDGEGLLDVRRPFGSTLVSMRHDETFRRVMSTQRPVTSNLIAEPVDGHHVVLIVVPVKSGGRVRYALGTSIDFQQRLRSVLARQQFPEAWTATVFDRQKLIVARTRDAAQRVGTPISADLAAQSTRGAEGWHEGRTLEGTTVYAAFSRSPITEWTVAIGIPADLVNASLRRSLMAVVSVGLTFLVIAAGLAVLIGRRIAASIGSLSPAAQALARGAALPDRAPSAVTEVEALARDFAEAAAILSERAADRARTEQERARLLARAETARAEAEVANRTKDEFLATVSHELRTPLTAVLGWARMLRSGRLGAEAITRGLEVIDRNARLQAQLIEDLLDVSRIITGKLRLDIRAIELVPVIEAALDAVRGAAEAKTIVLETVFDEEVGPVRGDPDRLQQVVWNLLANAIKFTPAAGRVTVGARAAGSEVEIAVTDTGQGIDGDFLPFVFDRFRQSDSARGSGGLGLGLAIVRHLTELHGGTVAVHSDGPGQGTTFTVRLPLASARDAAAAATLTRGGARFPSLAGVRVLVVDDDEDARHLLALILEQCEAEVVTAASAQEALRQLAERTPDVVVSDINMPEHDGYAFVRELRTRGSEAPRVPTVALTASARGEDRRRALAAGFDVHVAKPIEPAALAEIVAELVAGARRAREGGVTTGRV